jgi:hypothetical protein
MRRAFLWLGGLVAVLTAITIVIHVPAVQRRLGPCPFGYDQPSVGVGQTARTGPRAPARPALGFTLAATTRDELLAWASANGIRCTPRHGQRTLECLDVPSQLLAQHGAQLPGTTTWFELDARATLTAIKTVRRTPDAAAVASAFTATETSLRAHTGEPTAADGSADPAELSLGAFRQAMTEHEFADYRAQIRATNMGDGYILTESYAAL